MNITCDTWGRQCLAWQRRQWGAHGLCRKSPPDRNTCCHLDIPLFPSVETHSVTNYLESKNTEMDYKQGRVFTSVSFVLISNLSKSTILRPGQWEVSINVTWLGLTNERPVLRSHDKNWPIRGDYYLGLQEVRRPGQSLRAAKGQLTSKADTRRIISFESSNIKLLHSLTISMSLSRPYQLPFYQTTQTLITLLQIVWV